MGPISIDKSVCLNIFQQINLHNKPLATSKYPTWLAKTRQILDDRC